MKKSLVIASLLALGAASPFAHAYKAGDFVVRAGAATVSPEMGGSDVSSSATGKIAGSNATVSDNTQLGLTFGYMLTDHVGVELLAATPFKHSVSVKGLPAGLNGKLATIEQLPPTVTLQYFPMDSSSKWQPYVGAGINYTAFFNEDLTDARKAQGFSHLDREDSWGLALQAGIDYMLTDKVVLNAAVWRIGIDSHATARHPVLGKVKVSVEIDPWVYMVGVGYKF
ncbi:OmpW/AlkL family protein [Aromatoleum evansii]|uniref:OmpW family outer membrane protein n=1 Tax=Aromatoleum evansii TaxID=59406 RepID=A0ABZ1AE30_AROEV|nr:OmpW family outer membrane protein [Aromatoleum evansii]NMG29231.1 outer membrane beta-barrel protein [Aromatoleum evansii]WRL44080.1 OmpW family outer membrane protein [Aromatoleum evansii]